MRAINTSKVAEADLLRPVQPPLLRRRVLFCQPRRIHMDRGIRPIARANARGMFAPHPHYKIRIFKMNRQRACGLDGGIDFSTNKGFIT